MKSLGVVRKVDNLRRVAIPVEVRKLLNLKDGDSYMGYMHLCNAPSINNNYYCIYFRWSR